MTKEHRFGTDSFLLSSFSAPRRGSLACDLCGGCGIVAALWFRFPERAPRQALTVEIQPEAAELARQCAEASHLQGRLVPLCADLRDPSPIFAMEGIQRASFDLVACNPPYKREGHGIPSSTAAANAARHETMCTLEDVCRTAADMLRFGGRLCICQRPERLADAMQAMRSHGIEPKRLRFVQKRPETPPWLFLLEGRRGSRPFLRVDPPLIMQEENGDASAELRRIYEGVEA